MVALSLQKSFFKTFFMASTETGKLSKKSKRFLGNFNFYKTGKNVPNPTFWETGKNQNKSSCTVFNKIKTIFPKIQYFCETGKKFSFLDFLVFSKQIKKNLKIKKKMKFSEKFGISGKFEISEKKNFFE